MHAGRKLQPLLEQRAARRAAATFGLPVDIDPIDALLGEVHRTAGHVAWLADVVARLEPDELVWGDAEHTDRTGTDPYRQTVERAAPSVWVGLYQQERAHLAKVAKMAIDAGIDERRVRLAESQGEIVARVLQASLADLGVTFDGDVAAVVGRHLRAVS
jgi:hypothetical protein